MQPVLRRLSRLLLAAGVCASASSWANDTDALALQSDESADKPVAERPLRLVIEAGLGRISSREDGGPRDGRRLSVDLRYTARLNAAWRLRLSDRVDHVVPSTDAHETVNSLREAYAGWQSEDGGMSVDIGRVNVRQGPGLGYNPTDYLRTGGLRTVTTADPVALREQRLGTFMLRYSRLWSGGGLSVLLAPKLDDRPDTGAWAIDAGATNNTNRAVLSLSTKFSDTFNAQTSLLVERGEAPRLGASASALLTDALVVYGEAVTGKPRSVLDTLQSRAPERRQQAVLGATYTFPGALAVTLEAQHNGAGLDRAGWNQVFAQGPAAVQAVLGAAQRDQELAVRNAWLLHVGKTGLAGIQALEFKAFLRRNISDSSQLAWAELRYHWPRVDGVLQWQRSSGDRRSEFGASPYRQVVQLIGAFYW